MPFTAHCLSAHCPRTAPCAGDGAAPGPTDKVRVHYEGRLINGNVFDSSIARGQPLEFPLNGVIKGWTEGLQLMKPGGKAKLTYAPARMACHAAVPVHGHASHRRPPCPLAAFRTSWHTASEARLQPSRHFRRFLLAPRSRNSSSSRSIFFQLIVAEW